MLSDLGLQCLPMSHKQDDSRKWVKKNTQDALNRLFKPDPQHVSVEF